MKWRHIKEQDLEECLAIQPANLGEDLVGEAAARAVWRCLLKHPLFVAVAFEADRPVRANGSRIIGFGASAFVAPAFLDAELADPRPGINSRFMDAIHHGRPLLMSEHEVARANAGLGLDAFILSGSWDESILSAEEIAEIRTLVPVTYTGLNAGYRLNRIVWEAAGEYEIWFSRNSGVYREIAAFPELNRVLSVMTAETAFTPAASLGALLFTHKAPLLGLSAGDRHLLQAAQDGATDAELAEDLLLSPAAVKARWRSIFARIAEAKPDLAAEFDGDSGRGPQKRHRVLAYVREHPEELRPYEAKKIIR